MHVLCFKSQSMLLYFVDISYRVNEPGNMF